MRWDFFKSRKFHWLNEKGKARSIIKYDVYWSTILVKCYHWPKMKSSSEILIMLSILNSLQTKYPRAICWAHYCQKMKKLYIKCIQDPCALLNVTHLKVKNSQSSQLKVYFRTAHFCPSLCNLNLKAIGTGLVHITFIMLKICAMLFQNPVNNDSVMVLTSHVRPILDIWLFSETFDFLVRPWTSSYTYGSYAVSSL